MDDIGHEKCPRCSCDMDWRTAQFSETARWVCSQCGLLMDAWQDTGIPAPPPGNAAAAQIARALVSRWEHGDEAHRQWLRDVAIPDIAAALAVGEPLATGWAVQKADGTVIADFESDITEAGIWQIALGWPPQSEIDWHKARGARAFRCELREVVNATSEAKPE